MDYASDLKIYFIAIQNYFRATEPMHSLKNFMNSEFMTENLYEEASASDLKSIWVRRWNKAIELEEIEVKSMGIYILIFEKFNNTYSFSLWLLISIQEEDLTEEIPKWKNLEAKFADVSTADTFSLLLRV